MSAADTLEFRVELRPGAPSRAGRMLTGVWRTVNSSGSWSDLEARHDAVVVRRASGHPVLSGPVPPSLRRYLRRAVESDLRSMSESEFLRAWGPPGGWKERFDRWRDRGWVPPVR